MVVEQSQCPTLQGPPSHRDDPAGPFLASRSPLVKRPASGSKPAAVRAGARNVTGSKHDPLLMISPTQKAARGGMIRSNTGDEACPNWVLRLRAAEDDSRVGIQINPVPMSPAIDCEAGGQLGTGQDRTSRDTNISNAIRNRCCWRRRAVGLIRRASLKNGGSRLVVFAGSLRSLAIIRKVGLQDVKGTTEGSFPRS